MANIPFMTFIKNKNISLRALEKSDLAYLYKIENEASARQYGDSLMPHSKFVLEAFIKNADKDISISKQLRLVIEHNSSCETIGVVDLYDYSAHHQRAAVGIWVDEAMRQQGYALEALESLKNYAFDILLLHQLFCYINVDNMASVHLFQKAGFSISGTLKAWHRQKSGFTDTLVLQSFNN